jgi:hypothetical protein
MQSVLFTAFLLLVPSFLFGQTGAVLTVKDEEGKILPHATIIVKKNNNEKVFYADENGTFDIAPVEKITGAYDTLCVDSPGYELFCLGVEQLKTQRDIVLKQKTIFVAPVIVTSNKIKKLKLVRYGLRNSGGGGLVYSGHGGRIAVILDVKNPFILEKICFKVLQHRGEQKIRIHIFSFDDETENVLFQAETITVGKGWNTANFGAKALPITCKKLGIALEPIVDVATDNKVMFSVTLGNKKKVMTYVKPRHDMKYIPGEQDLCLYAEGYEEQE